MKIKTEAADNLLKAAREGRDFTPDIIGILKGIPKGHTVSDRDMREALGVGADVWWKFNRNRPECATTHRCYVRGKAKWAMPETIKFLLDNGARRTLHPEDEARSTK